MTDLLSKERLEKIAAWRETYGADSNVMIPAAEAEELARRELQRREAAEKPVAEICDVYELRYIGSGPISKLPVKVGAKLYLEPPLTSAERERLAELERVVAGLPQEAIDGGWTAKGISDHAKSLEARLAAYDRAAKEPAGWQARRAGSWFTVKQEDVWYYSDDDNTEIRKIFTAPPLPVVPDEITQETATIIAWGLPTTNIGTIFKAGYDRCRAAMLQVGTDMDGGTIKPTRYMNRYTGQCYTIEQQPGADTDTDVYVPLYERQPAKNTD